MTKRLISVAIIAFIFSSHIMAQHLSAYVDYMDRFYIFDHGESKKVDDISPSSFKIGGTGVLYINSSGHLMLYKDGRIHDLEYGGVLTSDYKATDYLLAYKLFEKIKVYYDNTLIELSNRCTSYQIEDSLIAFYDKNQESLRVFYKGEIKDIESGMVGNPIESWKSGSNTLAWISSLTYDFKVWYQNEIYTLIKNSSDTRYKAGQDIVAYIDPLDQGFKAFYKGEVYDLSDFEPQSYQVGFGFVAYVDQVGDFKIFNDEEINTISTITPDTFLVEDYTLAYIENGRLMTWYNNNNIEIEGWTPNVYKIDWHTIAYQDNSDRIWIFQNGERKYLSNELVNTFYIYRDLIQMNIRVNKNTTYYQGKFFNGISY